MLFKEKRKGSFQICFTFRHGSTRLTINPIIKRQGEGWSRSKRVGFEGRKKKKDPKLALHIEREGRPWEKKRLHEGEQEYYDAICPNYTSLITVNYFTGITNHDDIYSKSWFYICKLFKRSKWRSSYRNNSSRIR